MSVIPPLLMPVNFSENEFIRQSFAQNRLWFLHQMEPHTGQLNILIRLRLAGPALNEEKLASAFKALVERHSILQTAYRTTQNGSVQELASDAVIPLEVIDFTQLDPMQQKTVLDQWLKTEHSKPLDITTGQVLRPHLLKLANNQQEIIYTIHHIAFDGRSVEILLADLAQLYAGTTLPAVVSQYADFAAWETSYITADIIEPQLSFWSEHLTDVPFELDFKGRDQSWASMKAATHSFFINNNLINSLKGAAKKQRQTLFNTLITLFEVLIHHVSGQSRFLIGTDIHGRDVPALENILGFFVNQLIIKCELTPDLLLKELLVNTRGSVKASLAHRHLPFDILVSSLAPQRKTHRTPFFQVKLNYQPYRFNISSVGSAQVISNQIIQDLTGFDLVLDLTHEPQGIDAKLEYNQNLFSAGEIERFVSLWLDLIAQFETLVDLPISRISQQLTSLENTYLQAEQQAHSQQNRARLKSAPRKILNF